jgi:hypothetical protein
MTTISLDTLQLTDRIEGQIDWVDRYQWQAIGQQIRYALQGNVVVMENTRAGRPITLVAEAPWCWISATTLASLVNLVNEINHTFTFTWSDGSTYSVRFRREAGPLDMTPVNALKEYYTGKIYLIEV